MVGFPGGGYHRLSRTRHNPSLLYGMRHCPLCGLSANAKESSVTRGFDKDMPAVFVGGARHGELTTLKYGESFRNGDDIYLRESYQGCQLYCLCGLKDSANAKEYFEELNSISDQLTQLKTLTEQYRRPSEQAPEIPEFLYHYTELDSLALILKNQTLRFSRLDRVNDPEEAQAIDLPQANEAVFSSSWTATAEESIPLWSIYSGAMEGVRIRLPRNLFLGRCEPVQEPNNKSYQLVAPETVIDGQRRPLKIEREGLSSHRDVYWTSAPQKVRYSDLPADRMLRCFEDDGDDSLFFSLHPLGLVKKKHWSFEEEWRFRIFALSAEAVITKQDNPHEIDRFDLKRYPVKTEFLDVLLDPECLRRVQVTLGPRTTAAHRIYVESLLKEYAPEGGCQPSSFRVNR